MNHQEIQDQIPLYALGSLPAQDAAHLTQHLDICPSCRAELNEYQFVADELLEQVPLQTAPARLAVRLQNIVHSEAKRGFTQNAAAERNVRRDPPFWQKPLVLPRWAFAVALVAILLLLGGTGVLAYRLRTTSSMSREVTQLLTTRDLRYVSLTSGGMMPGDNGYICIEADNSTGLLWLYNLPPLDADHVYQVWLRNDTVRDNGGTFRADGHGRAVAVVHGLRPLNQYQEIGITIEPAAGSQAPTTPRVIGGRFD